jgi:hypothetical protein
LGEVRQNERGKRDAGCHIESNYQGFPEPGEA